MSPLIVKDLNEGFRRIEKYSYPLEDVRLRAVMGAHSSIGRILIVNCEMVSGTLMIVDVVAGRVYHCIYANQINR
jgi:hypothetical protein